MARRQAGTREEWRTARVELLRLEKEHTRRSDQLARLRRELSWVRIDKPYTFETDDGTKTLAQLFDGRSQLFVHHFMFGPDWDAGCVGCSMVAEYSTYARGTEVLKTFYQLLDRVPKGATKTTSWPPSSPATTQRPVPPPAQPGGSSSSPDPVTVGLVRGVIRDSRSVHEVTDRGDANG